MGRQVGPDEPDLWLCHVDLTVYRLSYFGGIQNFSEFNVFQKDAVNDIVPMLNGLIGEPVVATSDPTMANLRFAEANFVNQDFSGNPGNIPTAVGTPPDPFQFPTYAHGDMFFHSLTYISPVKGNFAYNTLIHELGHALGLKHGHEANQKYPGSNIILPALPTNHDSMEFSVMTYRSEVGGITDHYTNEDFGYAQTYMMDDIAALQYLYGADYGFNSGDTTYTLGSQDRRDVHRRCRPGRAGGQSHLPHRLGRWRHRHL